jgi:hypothetical protein
MNIRNYAVVLLLAVSAGATAAETASPWPEDATDTNDPRVVAFYDAKCASYAKENNLKNEEYDSYKADCIADAPALWPVGGHDQASD